MRRQKKDDEIRLIGSWDLGVLFQKVLQAGHMSGGVINKYIFKWKIIRVILKLGQDWIRFSTFIHSFRHTADKTECPNHGWQFGRNLREFKDKDTLSLCQQLCRTVFSFPKWEILWSATLLKQIGLFLRPNLKLYYGIPIIPSKFSSTNTFLPSQTEAYTLTTM